MVPDLSLAIGMTRFEQLTQDEGPRLRSIRLRALEFLYGTHH